MKSQVKHMRETDEYYFQEGCFILELLNTNDDPSVSIARARVEPGVTTRLHQLIGVTERYVIMEGKGKVEIGGLAPQELSVGDVAVIPPQCPQRITNIGPADLIFLAVCTPRFTKAAYRDIDTSGEP
jgi:mannose-6-phosphate isomerase-like protein (cupin superfamily)